MNRSLATVAVLAWLAGTAPAQVEPWPSSWVPSWSVLYGGYRQTEDLAPISRDESWGVDVTVVTTGGRTRSQTALVHQVGSLWRAEHVLDGVGLRAVALRDGRGFAVGDAGAIHAFDGTAWRPALSPARARLRDVAVASSSEAWAVGDLSTVVAWNGREWRAVRVPTSGVNLTAVAAPQPGVAWAAVDVGTVWRWNGTAWTDEAVAGLRDPRDIAFADADHGLVVGATVHERVNGRWVQVSEDFRLCESVTWVGADALLACDGGVHRYGGSGFATVDLAPARLDATRHVSRVVGLGPAAWALATDGAAVWIEAGAVYVRPEVVELTTLDVLPDGFGWAGGTAVTSGFVGAEGGNWTRAEPLPTGSVVRALDLADRGLGWAVGRSPEGDALVWRWDGTHWREHTVDKTWDLGDVQVLSADEAWAGRGNVVARWDGRSWQAFPDAPGPAAHGALWILRGGADPHGFFGSSGAVAELIDDEWRWQQLPGLRTPDLVTDLAVPDPGEGWAVTINALHRYDGATWHREPLPIRSDSIVQAVDATEKGNAWVLVEPEGLFHWNGFAWQRHSLEPLGAGFQATRLRALRMEPGRPSTDVWLVGPSPSIGRYRVVTPVDVLHLPRLLRGV